MIVQDTRYHVNVEEDISLENQEAIINQVVKKNGYITSYEYVRYFNLNVV